MYPELGLVSLPLYALPAGILGGLICGVTRGRGLLLAVSVASVLPSLHFIFGAVVSDDVREAECVNDFETAL